MFALTPGEQRLNLEEFCRKTKILLTNQERDSLHDILKQYQTYRDVRRLIVHLCSILNSPQKLDLLQEVRNLIPLSHVSEFDQLAPYSQMLHAYHPVGIIVETRPSVVPGRTVGDQQGNHDQPEEDVGSKLVMCIKREDGGLGFGIEGNPGRRGVIVSYVVSGSHAEKNGLKAGSQILEVNSIDFKNITLARALLVLQGSEHLRMKIINARPVMRTMIITGDTETTWVDTMNRKKVSTQYKVDPSQMDSTSGHERRVVLQLSDAHKFIGFNIRGGSEYGLGIYISRVDKGGLAETNGISVGDQIIRVNGESFELITHTQAVEFIKNLRHLILTIRNMNRYPAYKKAATGDYNLAECERKPKAKRPASVHLPVTEVILSAPFKDTKPKQPTAEIKPLPPTIVLEPPSLASKTKSLLSDNGIVQNTGEKSESSIQTEPSGICQKFADARMLSSQAPDDVKPTSQSSIATQTVEVSSPPLVPTADVVTVSPRMTTPPSTRKQPMTVMGTTALQSPHRRIGRSMSMKVPGEKDSLLLVNSPATKSKKVQRNRTFREVLFRVKHKDKEKNIEKNKIKERNKEKTTKEKKDQYSNCLLRDKEETQRREQCHHEELERLRRERQEEVRQLRIKAQDKDRVSSNMVEYGHIPLALWSTHETDKSHTISKRHKEPRQRLDNIAASEGSSLFRRNSNNDVGRETMTRNLKQSKNVSTNGKSHVIKPTSPPPPPPYMATKLPSPLPKYNATKSPSPSCMSTKPATPCSSVQPPISFCSYMSSPPSDTRILPITRKISVSSAPGVLILMPSPQTSKSPPTHLSTFQQPPLPPAHSTISPSLPTEVLTTPPDALLPHKDILLLHPPSTPESLTLPLPRMSTPPFCMTQLPKSPPPAPSVSPPLPPYLSSEGFLMATKINNNLNTITDKNKSNSDSNICSEINFNNMSIGNKTLSKRKTENIPEVCVTTANDKQCVFSVPLVATDVLYKCVTDKDDEPGDDVDLSKFSNDDDSSGNHTVESEDDETNSYNFIKEEGEETTNTSFDAVTSSPIDSINNSFSALMGISQTNSDAKDEFIGAKVNNKRRPARQETATVEFHEELEKRRSSSRVSFGEYQGTPLPMRRGILKNSFNRQEGAPTIETSNAASDCISISSDEEPSPLKEITSHARWRVQENMLRPSTNVVAACSSPQMGRKTLSVELPKLRSSIGISIAGGREIQAHPMVKIDKVFPGGAAADNGLLKPGFEVLSVDGTPLTSATHCEAVDIIRRSYNDKNKPTIEFVVIAYQ